MVPVSQLQLPFKSVAGALLLSLFLGGVGLLYATVVGGIVMVVVGLVIIPTKLPVPGALYFVTSAIWGVIATNRYNQRLMKNVSTH